MKSHEISNTTSIKWDAHACPPLTPDSDLSFLERYRTAGVNFLSLNVGFDLTSQTDTIKLIHYIRHWITTNNNQYSVIKHVDEILDCKNENKLALAFDIEGCNLLDGNLEMIDTFYELSVKQIVFSYNNNNISGGGCFDDDSGLTHFGKSLVRKCNETGMVIDCSHVGYQTSMDIINNSEFPVVFSHSNPAKLINHPRNITDDQIIACATHNGVIGINGIGIFLGNNNTSTERIVEHIDYVAQLVGSDHVGIGLDCIFDMEEIQGFVKVNEKTFPSEHGFHDVAVAAPEQFSEIGGLLKLRGYSNDDINKILGGNFMRVARSVWK